MEKGTDPLKPTQKPPKVIEETNQPPGTGILIDTEALLNNKERVYYILVNGWRIYGKTKEDVVTQLRNLSKENKDMIKTSSKVSSKMKTSTVGKSPSFFNKMKQASSSALGATSSALSSVWGATKGVASSAWEGTKKAGSAIKSGWNSTKNSRNKAWKSTKAGVASAGRGLSSAASATGRAVSSAASATGRGLAAAKQTLTDAMKKKEQAAATPGKGDNVKAKAAVQQAQADLKRAKRDAALKKHINSTKNMTEENVNNRIKGMFGGTRKNKSTTRK
jgi:hypothetical protein